MRIIIVGGGLVGYSLAEHLLKDKHHLTLVEIDQRLSQSISDKLDLQVLTGSGSSPAILKEAGIEHADMLLAVTPNDEVNILACAMAQQFGVKRRIARLRSREYSESGKYIDLEKLGITSVIHPEQSLVNHILQFVVTPHAAESADFEGGNILMRGYRVRESMELAGKTPREIRQQIAPNVVLFSAIVRRGIGMIPDGETRIEPGDL
ncbi:MAG: NAD-binding protein, partial [Candidatus Zixiibacteriota bacterium]